jgi:hypothetical protein
MPPTPRDEEPDWLLISVLFSSLPLTSAIAVRLQKAAFELHASDGGALRIRGAALQGEVRNLRRTQLLGTILGHAFEAELETERGPMLVRYLLTSDGVEHLARSRPREELN